MVWYTFASSNIFYGHVETVEAILEGEISEPDLTSHDVILLQAQVVDRGIIGICDSFGQTPVMWAVENGEVEVLKLLISNYL